MLHALIHRHLGGRAVRLDDRLNEALQTLAIFFAANLVSFASDLKFFAPHFPSFPCCTSFRSSSCLLTGQHEWSPDALPIVDCSRFCNDALCEQIDLKQEYQVLSLVQFID
jgi:hypothetical protein